MLSVCAVLLDRLGELWRVSFVPSFVNSTNLQVLCELGCVKSDGEIQWTERVMLPPITRCFLPKMVQSQHELREIHMHTHIKAVLKVFRETMHE